MIRLGWPIVLIGKLERLWIGTLHIAGWYSPYY